jgi:inosine-uridine nucleoside N-ribohydrolase
MDKVRGGGEAALKGLPTKLICAGVAIALVCGVGSQVRAQNTIAPRMVIIDQDASGPGGSDQMAMMVLLQSPLAKVLGITVVTGDAWEPEEVQHTLRMLEIIHRTDVPVAPGAVFPLVRNEAEAMAERAFVGTSPWYGAWTPGANHHGPFVVPPLKEGEPAIKPLNEDAAHFLIRQVHAHPHEVTIYAAGPLTNIALALAIDPQFAELTQGIVIMGGSLSPQTDDPEFATHPRHEFNFWFDPEAAHIVLRAGWPRVDLTTVDISVKTLFSHQMMDEIGRATTPAARYVAKYTTEYHYLWDELAAAAWLDPKIITKERVLYVDVDLTRGPNYGDALTWTEANRPRDRVLRPVHVQEDLDGPRFYREFVELMKAPPRAH